MDGDDTQNGPDYDVAIVGGGPAGASTGVFTARYGLDTVIFDRGTASLQRCAHLENYLGFPTGIDIETMYGLMHDHARTTGCEIRENLVESVERTDSRAFQLTAGETVTAERVVAATKYDADYLRPLGVDAMFGGNTGDAADEKQRFDRDYPAENGTTEIEGLYIASPSHGDAQAIMAAGRGARVARTVLTDARRAQGYPDSLADCWDWMRQETERTGEWATPERWHEYLIAQAPDDHGLSAERFTELREQEISRRFDAYLSEEEIEERRETAHRRLLEHVDDDAILDAAREIEAERDD